MSRIHWNGSQFERQQFGPRLATEVAIQLPDRHAPVHFERRQSYLQHYYDANCATAGALLYRDATGAACEATYSMIGVAIDDEELGVIGQIQTVENWETEALREINWYLSAAGCMAASIIPQGNVTEEQLAAAGFSRSRDDVVFWARSPQKLVTEAPSTLCVDAL